LSHEKTMNHAINQYFSGGHVEALRALEDLLNHLTAHTTTAGQTVVKTMTYIGEIRYLLGDYDGARDIFNVLLTEFPDTELSSFEHPDTIVGMFERVRRERTPPAPISAPASLKALPFWSYAPIGIPQFIAGDTRKGLLHGSAQLLFAAGSLATYAHLVSINGTSGAPKQWSVEQFTENSTTIQSERFLIQWPLTFAFYGTWYLSHRDARRTHFKGQETPTLSLISTGNGLEIHGRY
jgi:hypothetical protein